MAVHPLMHIVKLLQAWSIEIEGIMGIMICLGQVLSPSAVSVSLRAYVIRDDLPDPLDQKLG